MAEPARPLLSNEGVVGKHKLIKKEPFSKKGDQLESHHIPNKSFTKQFGIHTDEGPAVLTEKARYDQIHKLEGMKYLDNNLNPRSALAKSILGAREVYIKQNVYAPKIKQGLQEVSKLNQELYPHVYGKGAQPYTIKETTSINIQNQNKQKKSVIINDSTDNSSINNDLSSSSSTSKSNKPNDGIEMINMYQKSYSIKYGSKVNTSADITKIYNDANNQLINISNNDNSSHLNVIKTVQFLMFFIDYVTPQWIKTLILSLHPIKNMEKHFEYPNYSPKLAIELESAEDINYEKVELDEKNAISKKIKNEFDENLERSTISQGAIINYEEFIGKNKLNEDIVLDEANLFGFNNMMVDVY